MPVATVGSSTSKSQSACQYLAEAEEKKDKIILDDEIDWSLRLDVQKLYEKSILSDLDHSVAKHAEQSLWNFCYKNPIDTLHRRMKSKKNENDTAALVKFLSASLGFFSQLHTKIAIVYRFSAPGFKSLPELGVISDHFATPITAERDNLVYITHFCMIHMGDLCRYQKKVAHAESYYLHAAKISPSSGHPFNQLAILETARLDKLSSVYFYVRSLFVRNPFLLAASNLERFYGLVVANTAVKSAGGRKPVTTAANYVHSFLHFHAILDTSSDLKENEGNLQVHTDELYDELIPSLETASVSKHQILQMLVINIGSLWKIISWPVPDCDKMIISGSGETFLEETTLEANFKSLGEMEKIQYQLVAKLFVQQLSNLMKFCSEASDQSKKSEFASAVKCGLDWLRINHEILSPSFLAIGVLNDFLLSLCDYINRIQSAGLKQAKLTKETVPLPEDFNLLGFLPFEPYHKTLDFQILAPNDLKQIQRAEVMRIVSFGRWLSVKWNQPDLLNLENSEGNRTIFSTKVVKSKSFGYPLANSFESKESNDVNTLRRGSKDSVAENVPTLVGSGEGSPDSNKSGTPTAVKKQSKLVAMKTILSKNAAAMGENNAESKPLPEIVEIPKVPAKITIAASGTRVDLPLVTDRPESKDLTLGMGSMSLGKNTNTGGNNNSSRFELPPRFQAARLKLALGSNQQSSYNSASGGRPDGRDSADEMRQMSMPYQMPTQLLSNPVGSLNFPPLSMPPRMSTAELDKRNSSILANFTESKDFSMAAPVDQRLRSESLGGEDMTEPIGGPGGAASNFPKTPGVRPNLPPQFLFGGANLSSFSSSSNNNQNSSLIPSFPPPRLLRPENSDVLRKNSNGTNPVIGGLFNQRASNEGGIVLESNPWNRPQEQTAEQQRQISTQNFQFGLPFGPTGATDDSRKGIPALPSAPSRPPFLPFFPSFDPTRPPPNPSALPLRLPFAQLSSQQQQQTNVGSANTGENRLDQQLNSSYSLFSSPWPTSYPHYPQWSPNDGGGRESGNNK